VRAVAIAVAVVAAVRIARAAPDELVAARPLVLAPGEVVASLSTEIALDRSGTVGLAPDLWIGVTPRWTIGAFTSNASLDRVAAGGEPCLGVDVRWSATRGELAFAPRARAFVRSPPTGGTCLAFSGECRSCTIDQLHPAATIGALVRWTRGRFAIASDPYVRVGLADRETNHDALVLPIWFEVEPAARWVLAVHTGYGADLGAMASAWHVPLAADLRARVTAHVEVAIEIGFTSMVAATGAMQQRAATIAVAWRGR
jgi:hypothetical protein